jgi:hypothetical protein
VAGVAASAHVGEAEKNAPGNEDTRRITPKSQRQIGRVSHARDIARDIAMEWVFYAGGYGIPCSRSNDGMNSLPIPCDG